MNKLAKAKNIKDDLSLFYMQKSEGVPASGSFERTLRDSCLLPVRKCWMRCICLRFGLAD